MYYALIGRISQQLNGRHNVDLAALFDMLVNFFETPYKDRIHRVACRLFDLALIGDSYTKCEEQIGLMNVHSLTSKMSAPLAVRRQVMPLASQKRVSWPYSGWQDFRQFSAFTAILVSR